MGLCLYIWSGFYLAQQLTDDGDDVALHQHDVRRSTKTQQKQPTKTFFDLLATFLGLN